MTVQWSKYVTVRPEKKADVQALLAHMKTHGLKSSKKRAVVIEHFINMDRHFTVEQLYMELKDKYHIGYSTVYRALRLLVENGIAAVHHFGEGDTRFEPVHCSEHHDHLVCTQCGEIIEFRHDGIERLQTEVAARHGFSVDDHELQLFGLCRRCRTARKKKCGRR